jgi:cysteinyl-tRNA synthetase
VHYRKELNFSDETIETARKELEKVTNPMKQAEIKAALSGIEIGDAYEEESYRAFLDQMDDDMNTPNAYTVIFDTVKRLNQAVRTREIDWQNVGRLIVSVEKMLAILGIEVERPVITSEDREMFAKWKEAKQAKDFAQADVYRKALSEKGLLA